MLKEPSGKTEALPSFFGSQIITRTYQYGVAGKANGPAAGLQLTAGSLYSVTYGYDDVLRPQTVTYNGGTPFTYAYVTDSNLIDTVTQGAGYKRDYGYKSDRNRLDTLQHSWGAVPTTETRLDYDPAGRSKGIMGGSDSISGLTRFGRSSRTAV